MESDDLWSSMSSLLGTDRPGQLAGLILTLQPDLHTLSGQEGRGKQHLGFLLDLFQIVVGMGRIVVEKGQTADIGLLGDLDRLQPTAVSPGGTFALLLRGELGIMDEQIRIPGQVYDPAI